MPTDHTELETSPNLSTEHQRSGDARPSDTLDKGQTEQQPADRPEDPKATPGGNAQEAPEDRPNVGSVTPEDYPADERAGGGVSGGPTQK